MPPQSNNRRGNRPANNNNAPPIPDELLPEVRAAVDDMISGSSTNSVPEWLQREFQRLMHREALYLSQKHAADVSKTAGAGPG
jgi:hypothetical protein